MSKIIFIAAYAAVPLLLAGNKNPNTYNPLGNVLDALNLNFFPKVRRAWLLTENGKKG